MTTAPYCPNCGKPWTEVPDPSGWPQYTHTCANPGLAYHPIVNSPTYVAGVPIAPSKSLEERLADHEARFQALERRVAELERVARQAGFYDYD